MIKNTIVKLLRRLLTWLDTVQPVILVENSQIARKADELVQAAEKLTTSGEYKKFQVCLALMMKAFPGARKKDLCLAIELAVQKLP